MSLEWKESDLNNGVNRTDSIPDKKEDLFGTLNLENPRIKWEIEYNWQTALLIKYDKKYEQLKYSGYAIVYMWKIYNIGWMWVKNCIIKWITKDGIIISYCNELWGWDVKWNSMMFDWKNLNNFPHDVREIKTLDEGKNVLICSNDNKDYALYNGIKSPDFDAINWVKLFNWKLAVIWCINGQLLVSVWDKVYWKWEWRDSVELLWWEHMAPRIKWTKKWETLIN